MMVFCGEILGAVGVVNCGLSSSNGSSHGGVVVVCDDGDGDGDVMVVVVVS